MNSALYILIRVLEGDKRSVFMVKYRLIIEYHKKGNNNTQVATLEQVSSYIGYLFGQYQPYMWWVLLATESVAKGKLK